MDKEKPEKKEVKKEPPPRPRPYRHYEKSREEKEADDIRRYWREYEGEGGAF